MIQGSDGNFYGTTNFNGVGGDGGTVFKMTPVGSLTTLITFTGANGANPYGSLVQGSDGNFYGTTAGGGNGGEGTVYELTPGGVLTTLCTLTGTNGSYPYAGLTLGNDGNLYGTTYEGGSNGYGTVFKVTPPFLNIYLDNSVSYQITATNNPTSYGATGLPAGLSVNTTSGLISGAPTVIGTFNATISASNAGGTGTAALLINVRTGSPTITDGPPPSALVNTSYSFTYTYIGAPAPTFLVTSGALPPGLSLSPAGVISGTPTAVGVYTGVVTASNGIGTPATQSFSISVQMPPTITDGPPPGAIVGTAYNFAYTATGNPAPTFAVTSGGLPTGLVMSSSGVISGTPTAVGLYTGVVTAANGVNPPATQSFSIAVAVPTPVASPEPPFTVGTTNTVSWNSINGATDYDVQASTSPAFATVVDSGWITGTTYTFGGLTTGATYYYRVRAAIGSGAPDSSWSQASQSDFSVDALTNVTNGSGNLYVADYTNDTIRKIASGNVVTTLAGVAGSVGSVDGTGTGARFDLPVSGAVDANDNLYVADYGNDTIRKITPAGVVTTFAGLAGSVGSTDGTGSAARFNGPFALAFDGSGNLYVADRWNETIREITPGAVVTTIAGSVGSIGSTDGTGTAARFNGPAGIALDPSGNIYVADTSNSTIRKIAPGGVVTTLAGVAGFFGSTDGTGSAAVFNNPSSMVLGANGNFYVTDNGSYVVRMVTPGGTVTTVAGLAGYQGSTDGTGSAARFYRPQGISSDSGGNVYVADDGNDTIRKIASGGVVTTLAGLAGNVGSTDGTGSAARFNYPQGVTADIGAGIALAKSGSVFTSSGTVVSVPIAPSPFQAWGSVSFVDNVSGSGTALTVDVLNSSGALLLANVASGTNLGTIPALAGVTSIELRANLSTSNTANTPTLSSWSVSYYGDGLTIGGWSSTVSSTQGLAPFLSNGPPPAITTLGTSYSFLYQATGLPTPTFTVSTGALPPGLALSTGGLISGTSTATGVYTGTIRVDNGLGTDATQNFSITVDLAPSITDGPPPAANINAPYNFAYSATGYPAPTFSVAAGSLPPGLTLSPGGTISGTPTAAGLYAGVVMAGNGVGSGATQNFSIRVRQSPAISNGPPPDGTVGTPYSFAYLSGGSPAPTFSVTAGSLPPGLTLSSAGTISGTPLQNGTFTGIVTADNGIGTDATQSFTINVSAPTTDTPTMPPWALAILGTLLVIAASTLLERGRSGERRKRACAAE